MNLGALTKRGLTPVDHPETARNLTQSKVPVPVLLELLVAEASTQSCFHMALNQREMKE